MYHINELTAFDIIWHAPDMEKVHAFVRHPIPVGLDLDMEKDYYSIKKLCLETQPPKYCIASTKGYLEFIFVPLIFDGRDNGMLRIGPLITNPIDENRLSDIMLRLDLPLREHQVLRHFYDSLQLVPTHFFQNLGYLAMNAFGHNLPRAESVIYQSEDFQPLSTISTKYSSEDMEGVDIRYEHERLLRYAIANHDKEALKKAVDFFEDTPNIKDRYPDNPLRSAKNLAIVLNTILRHAAEDGGLNPIYLDRISTKFAILIEQATTRTGVVQLHRMMYDAYFEAVMEHAYPQASPFIRKVIDFIQLNLDDNLSLTTLSNKFNMAASNLANLFKSETGMTVSEFVNQLRIKEACHYLIHTTLPVSTISHMVGIVDSNYFTRIFKRAENISPSEYRSKYYKS